MRSKRIWTVGAFILLLLAAPGCARKNHSGRYTEILQGHVGSPVQNLVAKLGVPAGYFRNENGTIYEWEQRGRAWDPWIGAFWGNCTTRVTTDSEDTILSFTWKGNACGQL